MLIGTGEQRYRWMDGWGDVPQKRQGYCGLGPITEWRSPEMDT